MKIKKLVTGLILVGILNSQVGVFAGKPLPTNIQIVSAEILTIDNGVPTLNIDGIAFAVTDLNIRDKPDGNIVGQYAKGDRIKVIELGDEWTKTDKGYVWTGYLSDKYKVKLNLDSDSEHASMFSGYVESLASRLNPRYRRMLEKYNIHLVYESDVLNKRSDGSNLEDDSYILGRTSVGHGDRYEREMWLRCLTKNIEDTLYHELGHAYDFEDTNFCISDDKRVQDSYKTEYDAVVDYFNLGHFKITDVQEYFAEVFKLHIKYPDELKEVAPEINGVLEELDAHLDTIK